MTTTQTPPRTGLVLTPDEARRAAEPALEVAGRYPTSDGPELLQEAPLFSARRPERVQRLLRAEALDRLEGHCVLSSHLIDDLHIGLTPSHWNDETRPHHELPEEILLVLYAALVGEPFGWATDAVPVGVAGVDFTRLPEDELDVLFADRFHLLPDSSHLPTNNTVTSDRDQQLFAGIEKIINDREPFSVLFGSRRDPLLRFDASHMTPVEGDDKAARAFASINELLEQSRRRCPLATDDFVFLNNHRVVHARTSFTARYDGTDRWLKRINITHDLRKSADLRRPATPRLIG